MKISVGVKIFGVVVVLMILVGAAAWYNADKLQDVQTLLQDVHDTYIPAYQGLARANLRSVEEGLYARRLVITRLQAPDDKATIQRLELAASGKSRDADAELAAVPMRIWGFSSSFPAARHPESARRPPPMSN